MINTDGIENTIRRWLATVTGVRVTGWRLTEDLTAGTVTVSMPGRTATVTFESVNDLKYKLRGISRG
jgi:energy-converting hydrogenase Eha subunit H